MTGFVPSAFVICGAGAYVIVVTPPVPFEMVVRRSGDRAGDEEPNPT
jgi:uncharacterized membrane protein